MAIIANAPCRESSESLATEMWQVSVKLSNNSLLMTQRLCRTTKRAMNKRWCMRQLHLLASSVAGQHLHVQHPLVLGRQICSQVPRLQQQIDCQFFSFHQIHLQIGHPIQCCNNLKHRTMHHFQLMMHLSHCLDTLIAFSVQSNSSQRSWVRCAS